MVFGKIIKGYKHKKIYFFFTLHYILFFNTFFLFVMNTQPYLVHKFKSVYFILSGFLRHIFGNIRFRLRAAAMKVINQIKETSCSA